MLDTWRLLARVASFDDLDMVLAVARRTERDRDAAHRYYFVVEVGVLVDLDDAIRRGDLGAIRNHDGSMAVMLDD